MDGLMTYALVISPLNPQRLYVLTLPSIISHTGIVGLYTSAAHGRTWKLSIPTTSLTSTSLFVVAPGNETPGEDYVHLPELAPLALEIIIDNRQHFSETGTLPFESL